MAKISGRLGVGQLAVPDRSTLIAFVILIILGGSNAVAVRLSNIDLPPFWGASIRFGLTALVFWAILIFRRFEIPRGRALIGTMIYGMLAVGLAYGFLYWGLVFVSASLTMVILALIPLFTLLLAVLHRIEPFRWRGLLGALVALLGIGLIIQREFEGGVLVGPVLALVGGALCLAEASVFFKLIPPIHPVATNAVAVTTGAVFLFLVSLITGESWSLPSNRATWFSYLYLVFVGSVLLFYLFLYVLSRWTASATSYAWLLFPISTIVIETLLTGDVITIEFLIGGTVVMLGVWIGAISKPAREPE